MADRFSPWPAFRNSSDGEVSTDLSSGSQTGNRVPGLFSVGLTDTVIATAGDDVTNQDSSDDTSSTTTTTTTQTGNGVQGDYSSSTLVSGNSHGSETQTRPGASQTDTEDNTTSSGTPQTGNAVMGNFTGASAATVSTSLDVDGTDAAHKLAILAGSNPKE